LLASGHVYSADDFFYRLGEGKYAFDADKLPEAHQDCQETVEEALRQKVPSVAVANTFSKAWEAAPYYKLADQHGYSVFVIECQSQFGNVHDVPAESIRRMIARWEPLRRPNEERRDSQDG
jgi:hypothetical protein